MSWDKPMQSLAGPGRPTVAWVAINPPWATMALWRGYHCMVAPTGWPPETFKQCACYGRREVRDRDIIHFRRRT